MMRYCDDFPALLDGFKLETLEADPNSIFGLSKDLLLIYMNPGWFDFARANAGEPAISERFTVGENVADSMTGEARDYYLNAYQHILNTGEVWHHDYECSSPDKFRIFHQSTYPLYKRNGLIVVNSLINEQPHDPTARIPHEPDERLYTQESGFITQCCNCRRVQRVSGNDLWDWVPAWVESIPDNSSHTFCHICYDYYFRCKY
jgi:hypothetical protein